MIKVPKLKERLRGGLLLLLILFFIVSILTWGLHVANINMSSISVVETNLNSTIKNAIPAETCQDLANQASHIISGEVRSIESRWNTDGMIYSYVNILVEEYTKGTPQGAEITVKHLGGEVGVIGLLASTEPCFAVGERVKVYLKLEEAGEFTVVQGKRGKTLLTDKTAPASAGYSYSGIHWDDRQLPVRYYINELGTPDTIGEFMAVQNSFQTWEDDPDSYIDYSYMGNTTRFGGVLDGFNVVSWGLIDGPGGTLAVTTIWYNVATRVIFETDIVFDEAETWSTTGETDKFDIQNIGTHEAGHTLSLDDLYNPEDSEETMYGYASPGEAKKRSLHTGDIAGVRFIYLGPFIRVNIYYLALDSEENVLANAKIEVACPNGTILTLYTDSQGKAYLNLLPVGSYNATVHWMGVTVGSFIGFISESRGYTITCDVYDLTIEVTDLLGYPVSGVDVTVYWHDGGIVTSGKTDSNGKVLFSQLPKSDYSIQVSYFGQTSTESLSLIDTITKGVRVYFSPTVLALITLPTIIIAIIVIAIKRRKAPPTYYCPTCGEPLIYVKQYGQWYCQNCRKYV